MDSRSGRSIEVDFFRGIVPIVIVLDHIPSSAQLHLMLRVVYTFCDSAEVFVFPGGYASAGAYTAVLARRGSGAVQMRFIKRCGEIYRGYLATAVLTLVPGEVAQGAEEIEGSEACRAHPITRSRMACRRKCTPPQRLTRRTQRIYSQGHEGFLTRLPLADAP